MEWFKTIGDFLQYSKKIIFTVFVISSAILWLGEENLAFFKLEGFLQEYGKYIGIATLISGAYIIVEILLSFKNFILKYIESYKIKQKQKQKEQEAETKIFNKLLDLDPHEKAVLREFYIQRKNTIKMPMDDPHIAGLLKNKILQIISQQGEHTLVGLMVNMQITEIIKSYITYDMLDMPENPTEEEKRIILQNRPHFATYKGWH